MEQEQYELPEKWEWSTVKEISTKIQYGYTTKATESGNAKFLRITDIQNGNIRWASVPFVSISDKELSKYRLQSNDLVFARSGATAGKSILIEKPPKDAIFASYLIRVIPTCLIIPHFLALFFQSPEYWKQVETSASGAAQPNINGTKLSGFQVPLPPLNEQKRIVARLDALFSRIDTAITHLQETIELSKALFASVLDSAFVPTRNIENPPKAWSCEILQTVSNLVTDGTHHSPKEQFDSEQKGLFKYVTSKNIKFDGLKLNGITYIRKEVHDEIIARCNPEYLDQLITKDGAMTGTCCLNTLDEPFSLLSSVALVKLKRELMQPHFLNYFLQSPTGQELMIGDISGAAITRTNLRKLKALKVPLPPMDEQRGIVTHLDALSERTRALEAATGEKLNDLTALKASLLDAAFKGQLLTDARKEAVK